MTLQSEGRCQGVPGYGNPRHRRGGCLRSRRRRQRSYRRRLRFLMPTAAESRRPPRSCPVNALEVDETEMAASTAVVVGSSVSGVRAAQALRAEGFSGPRLILVGEESELPYDKPPLSKGFLHDSNGDTHNRLLTAEVASELKSTPAGGISDWARRRSEKVESRRWCHR